MSRPSQRNVEEAKRLGVKDPERLSASELGSALALFRRMAELRKDAAGLGIELPADIVNWTTLVKEFDKLVLAQLRVANIDVGSEVAHSGKIYVVERTARSRRDKLTDFVVKPEKGSREYVASARLLSWVREAEAHRPKGRRKRH